MRKAKDFVPSRGAVERPKERDQKLAAVRPWPRAKGHPEPREELDLPAQPARPWPCSLLATVRRCVGFLRFLPAHSHVTWPLSHQGSYFLPQHMLIFFLPILLKCSHLSLTFVKMASPPDDFANSLIQRLPGSQLLLQFREPATRWRDSVQTWRPGSPGVRPRPPTPTPAPPPGQPAASARGRCPERGLRQAALSRRRWAGERLSNRSVLSPGQILGVQRSCNSWRCAGLCSHECTSLSKPSFHKS